MTQLNDILTQILSQKTAGKENIQIVSLDKIGDLLNQLFSEDSPQEQKSKVAPTEKTQETQQQAEKVDSDVLVKAYAPLLNETFIHTKTRNRYVLLELLNLQSTDQDHFPVMAVYFDKQLKTKWTRPLVEFAAKFKLVV